jgi:hypothetical protein
MNNIGKMMAIAGIILFVTGLVIWMSGKFPFIGKLPGDFFYRNKNFSFYFPLASSIVASILISLLLYLIRKFL